MTSENIEHMALSTKSTETTSIRPENINSRSQFREYQNILNILADESNMCIIYNYALYETIRLTESLVGCEITDDNVRTFVSKAAEYLSKYKWTHYEESNSRLELLLRAMSSVLHIVSNSVTMIQTDVRDSLYKSVSRFWHIYRNTNSINANIMFTLREIRTCLRKIRDDKSRVISRGGDLVNVIVSVVQKDYLEAFNSFINVINFEYAAGKWYYKWEEKREKYFESRRKYLEDTSNPKNPKGIQKIYKKLYKSSLREFQKVKRKNTKYRNFEYKVLKSGGSVIGCSLPDHIDTLLIGYLDLIYRLLEEFFTQMDIEDYIETTITLCNDIIEDNAKKQLTFKAVEILYIIKENSKKEEIRNEIELNFKNWTFSTITTLPPQLPQILLDDTLTTSNSISFNSMPSPSSSKFNGSSKPNNIVIPPPTPIRNSFASTPSTSSSKFNKAPLDTPTSIYTSFSTPPMSPISTSTSHEDQKEKQKQRRILNVRNVRGFITSLSDFQKVRQQQSIDMRKRIVNDVIKLFEQRRRILKNIEEIKKHYFQLSNNEDVDKNSILIELKKIMEEIEEERKEREKERKEREEERNRGSTGGGDYFSGNFGNRTYYEMINYNEQFKMNPNNLVSSEIMNYNEQVKMNPNNRISPEIINYNEQGKMNHNNQEISPEIINHSEQVDQKVKVFEKSDETEIININEQIDKEDDKLKSEEAEIINNNEQVDKEDDKLKSEEAETININEQVDKEDDKLNEAEIINNNEQADKEDGKLKNEEAETINNNEQVDKEDDKLNETEIININEQIDKEDDKLKSEEAEIININEQIDKEDDKLKSEETETVNNNEQIDKEDDKLKSEETETVNINKLKNEEVINNNEQVDKEDDKLKSEETETVNNEQVDKEDDKLKSEEAETINNNKQADEEDDNLEKKHGKSEERRISDVSPPEITVEDTSDSEEDKTNVIINHYNIVNNVTNVQPEDEDTTFLRKAIKKITENIEYIADQAAKGRQAALRLSNNNSSTSVNEINENEKEVKGRQAVSSNNNSNTSINEINECEKERSVI